jgi:hypothetical protein
MQFHFIIGVIIGNGSWTFVDEIAGATDARPVRHEAPCFLRLYPYHSTSAEPSSYCFMKFDSHPISISHSCLTA